jgi:ribose transport system permease protein
MPIAIQRFISDYGMISVLLGLCAYFSAVTVSEQNPTDKTAARQLAAELIRSPGKGGRVFIAVRRQPEDTVFADELERELTAAGIQVAGVVTGEPRDAREALQKLNTAGLPLDVIAGNQVTASWLVFSDLSTSYPALGHPRIVRPRSYRWPNFLKSANLLNIANQIAVIAVMAIGMTMVIITAGIDLSVGSLIALSAVLSALFIRDYAGGLHASATGMTLACVAAIALCGCVGALTGGMITYFGMPPFIVTLAVMFIGSGLAYRVAHEQSIYQIPDSFVWLGGGADFLHLPNAVVLMLILYALAHILMSRMRIGRYLYAVGGNREAARLSGVPVRRVLLFAYIGSAVLAGVGGVIMASNLKSGSPTYGNAYELYVIAAVVVGGTSLSGGEGRMLNTLIGAFTIAVIQNGMNLTNVESQTQKIVFGLVILAAVWIDTLRHRGWRMSGSD